MSTEIELKLSISPQGMETLKQHPFFQMLATGPGHSRHLHNVYFDTPDLHFHDNAMALRLRHTGTHWLQTMKGGGGVQAGLHLRNEWETPVPGRQLDFAALEQAGAPAFPAAIQNSIRDVFTTDFTRITHVLHFEGAEIEACMDSGEIRCGSLAHPISEIELELKSGQPLQLYQLALALHRLAPMSIEATSKAEYGYRLFRPVTTQPRKAALPAIDSTTPVDRALQQMIWACLEHLQANLAGAIADRDDEYLHQVRVALRRLCVVLDMCARQCHDDELQALYDQVRKVGGQLGVAREWDVFTRQILVTALAEAGQPSEYDWLLRTSETQRSDAHSRAERLLQGANLQAMLLRFGAWMSGPYWQAFAREKELLQYSAKRLKQLDRLVRRRAACLRKDKIAAAKVHKLRIACKNLRYCAEYFAALYPGHNFSDFVQQLENLQDELGNFNDHVVGLVLLDKLDQPSGAGGKKTIRKQLRLRQNNALKKVRRCWKQFAATGLSQALP